MKKIINILTLIAILCSFLCLTACSTEVQNESVDRNEEQKENKSSRYVVVEDIGDGYVSSFDKVLENGEVVQIMNFEWVVDRKTKQIFIYDTYCNDIPDSFETFVLQPLLENGEPVYYNGELPK